MSSHHDLIQKITQRLEDWDYTLDRIEHRIQDLPKDARETAEEKYQQLKEYQQKLKAHEEELKDASEHAIKDAEESVEDIWGAMKLLFEDLKVDVKVEFN